MNKNKNSYSQFNYLLLGLGASNQSAAKLLDLIGAHYQCINRGPVNSWIDQLPKNVRKENCFSEEDLTELKIIPDIIILSPGVPRNHHLIGPITNKVRVWTEIELAYKFCKIPVIGITGSNGKTTTTTLIGEMVKNCGYSPFIGGNIGVPFCEMILQEKQENKKYDFAVLELSSFQLESIEELAPQVAVILNITPNHQERYQSIEEYAHAKFNITKNMGEHSALIYPRNSELIDSFAQKQMITILPFNSFIINEELGSKFNLSQFKLKGDHNRENLYAAYKVINFLQLNEEGIQKTIDNFSGVEYRIQPMALKKYPFAIYNDAKSSNIEATTKAVNCFTKDDSPLYLIYGGQKRDKSEKLTFPKDLLQKINKILLIGETTDELYNSLTSSQDSVIIKKCYTLENVKKLILEENLSSGTVLFSPGFPSFDQFKNYKDRGKFFSQLW